MTYVNPCCTNNCLRGATDGKLQCNCGENIEIFNWLWLKTSQNVRITNSNKDILFHPVYSTGTAVLRGETPLKKNKVHYWEVKFLSRLDGTGVMTGVGTSETPLSSWKFKFGNVLGIDSKTWGYSHHGFIQNDKLVRKYGSAFSMGNLVGACLDMCRGTLEYYVNRKPQGIAFRGLKSYELFPMLSSTIADSAVRTTCAVSENDSLQFLCLQRISKHPVLSKRYNNIPGLKRLYEKKYFWLSPSDGEQESESDTADKEVSKMWQRNSIQNCLSCMPKFVYVDDG